MNEHIRAEYMSGGHMTTVVNIEDLKNALKPGADTLLCDILAGETDSQVYKRHKNSPPGTPGRRAERTMCRDMQHLRQVLAVQMGRESMTSSDVEQALKKSQETQADRETRLPLQLVDAANSSNAKDSDNRVA